MNGEKKLTEQDQNTLQYYDQNAAKFVVNTKRVEFHFVQDISIPLQLRTI